MKPKLKPPGTERLKLKCDILLSTSAFKFNSRRYITDATGNRISGVTFEVRVLPGPPSVGRCRLKPVFASTE